MLQYVDMFYVSSEPWTPTLIRNFLRPPPSPVMTSYSETCPWDLGKFRTLPLYMSSGTWKNSEISLSIGAINFKNYKLPFLFACKKHVENVKEYVINFLKNEFFCKVYNRKAVIKLQSCAA